MGDGQKPQYLLAGWPSRPAGVTLGVANQEPAGRLRRGGRGGGQARGARQRDRQRLGGAAVALSKGSVRLTNGCAWNAVSAFANCGRAVAHVRGSYVPIVLQNDFAHPSAQD